MKRSCRLLLFFASVALACVLAIDAARAATPLVNARLSGADNELVTGATLTINGTLDLGSGSITGTQPLDATLTALAGMTTSADKLPLFTGTDTVSALSISALSQSLLALSTSQTWFSAIAPSSPTTGDVLQYNGTSWAKVSLGSLSTGLLKVTTSTGALTTATAGTDYVAPGAITSSGLTLPTSSLAGRTTTGTGAIEVISPGDGIDLSSTTLNATGLFRSRAAKTGAYTVVAADKGKLIDCTSGTFSVSLTAAATLGAGFHVGVYNSGSGTITIDADGSETIRDPSSSATTKTLAQGEGMVLVCDGTGFLVPIHARSTGGAGTGDVVGPASSTDARLALFDSTTGKLLKQSTALTESGGTITSNTAIGLTAGGSNQNVTLTPSGTGRVSVVSSASGSVTPMDIMAGSANYIQYNVGKDSTHYFTAEWDAVANNGNFSTYALSYPIRIRASQIELATGVSDTNRVVVNGSGNVRFNAYGAGTLTTDGSGNITASSDARLKTVDGDFTRGLADLRKLTPVLYHWLADSGLDPKNQYAGFIAQDVQAAIPEAVSTAPDGMLSLSDRPIIAALVNATKELDVRVATLERVTRFLSVVLCALGGLCGWLVVRRS